MYHFSIIIATFNAEKYLERCLCSIFNQSFSDYQILVQDNNSKDQTCNILNRFKDRLSFYGRDQDTGIYHAWNICLEHVNGKYVSFLGADDWYHDLDFFKKIHELTNEKNFLQDLVVHGGNRVVIENSGDKEIFPNINTFKSELNSYMSYRHPGSFYSLGLVKKIGNFDNEFKISGDHDYALRCVNSNFVYYDFASVSHQTGGASMQYKNMMTLVRENYRIRKKHGIKPYLILNKTNLKRIFLYGIYLIFGGKVTNKIHNIKIFFTKV
jgi:glycosyltransferase involved in cell wall biosynthesis